MSAVAEEADLGLNTWYRLNLHHHMPIITSKDYAPLRDCTDPATETGQRI